MMFTMEKKLAVIFCIALFSLYLIRAGAEEGALRFDERSMHEAVSLAGRWFTIVENEKRLRGISSSYADKYPHGGLIGEEYSEMTTTTGSLTAKHTALNPQFAALFVRMLHDAGIDSGDVVGVALSGSFPSLSISMFAALQTIGARTAIVSSLGASSFGANQSAMTWIDIERTLQRSGGLRYRSDVVTLGAENDTGGGLSAKGIALLTAAAKRNNVTLTGARGFSDAVLQRVAFFSSRKIALLVNIGGNHAMMGNCLHSSSIPNGYHRLVQTCLHEDRGAIFRLNEMGIPLLHILNIRSLAVSHGLPLEPNGEAVSPQLYRTTKANTTMVLLVVAGLSAITFFFFRKNIFTANNGEIRSDKTGQGQQ